MGKSQIVGGWVDGEEAFPYGITALKSCLGAIFLDEEGMGMFAGCGGKACGER